MNKVLRNLILAGTLLTVIGSNDAFAALSTFDKVVWIPYWRKTEGASSTLAHLSSVTQISPFAYELQTDGTILRLRMIHGPL